MDALQQWWDGLSDEDRAEAQEARKTRRLSPKLEGSLRDAGVLDERKHSKGSLPGDVETFLKARH
ncbi:MAG: hypothetical protein U0R28_12130 [Candidatus Nanopelagicales bacterium]